MPEFFSAAFLTSRPYGSRVLCKTKSTELCFILLYAFLFTLFLRQLKRQIFRLFECPPLEPVSQLLFCHSVQAKRDTESSIFNIFWIPAFAGMTMVTASLRLRHSLLEGARGRNHAILQPVFFHLRPASSGPPPPAEDIQKVFIYLIAGAIIKNAQSMKGSVSCVLARCACTPPVILPRKGCDRRDITVCRNR